MRITVPTFDQSKQTVRDLLAQARAATTLGEAAHYQRLARIASEK